MKKTYVVALCFIGVIAISYGIWNKSQHSKSGQIVPQEAPLPVNARQAVFAMGCFWCGEDAFYDQDKEMPFAGIYDVTSGYAGKFSVTEPTYRSHKGYVEAVRVTYDSSVISYSVLLDIFWHNVDPFDAVGQFCDKGPSYISIIYYNNDEEKKLAEATKAEIADEFKQSVLTQILPMDQYYLAEEYHQDYARKNPIRYKYYKGRCGREDRLKEIWGTAHFKPKQG